MLHTRYTVEAKTAPETGDSMSLRERRIEKDIKARQNVEKKMAAEEQKRKEAEEYRRKEKERRASLTPQERKEEA